MKKYIVRTADGYLRPAEDGAVTLTGDKEQAGHFLSTAEAIETAEQFGCEASEIDVIPVAEPAQLIRQ